MLYRKKCRSPPSTTGTERATDPLVKITVHIDKSKLKFRLWYKFISILKFERKTELSWIKKFCKIRTRHWEFNVWLYFWSFIKIIEKTLSGTGIKYVVSVLWEERGYAIKYSLSQREVQRTKPMWIFEKKVYNYQCIPNLVIIRHSHTSKNDDNKNQMEDEWWVNNGILRIN